MPKQPGEKMIQDDLQYVVAMLKDMNLQAVAKSVGLSYRTVWGIANESNKAPSFSTVRKIAEYFRAKGME